MYNPSDNFNLCICIVLYCFIDFEQLTALPNITHTRDFNTGLLAPNKLKYYRSISYALIRCDKAIELRQTYIIQNLKGWGSQRYLLAERSITTPRVVVVRIRVDSALKHQTVLPITGYPTQSFSRAFWQPAFSSPYLSLDIF
jgi:hypothetical protein